MNRAEVTSLIEASLARPTSTPNTSGLAWEEFIEVEKSKLRQALIDPIDIDAYPGDWALQHCGFENRPYPMLAIAKEQNTYLLYDRASHAFYQAWSSDEPSFKLYLLGYYSDDALAEWRG